MAAQGTRELGDGRLNARNVPVEPYCILCRATLQVQQEWLSNVSNPDEPHEEPEPWSLDVFCCEF